MYTHTHTHCTVDPHRAEVGMLCPEFTAVVKPSDSSGLWALEKERVGLLKIIASHQTSIREHSGRHICHESQLHTCQSNCSYRLDCQWHIWGGGVWGGGKNKHVQHFKEPTDLKGERQKGRTVEISLRAGKNAFIQLFPPFNCV